MPRKKKSIPQLEKQEDKKPIETEETPTTEKKDKQFYWILIGMAAIIIVFFSSYFFLASLNSFNYNGLTFTKEKFGDIPVFHHYYNFNVDGQLVKYNLFLRNDPRKNNIPVTGSIVDEGLEFRRDNFVYISVDPEDLTECEYSRVGISTLAAFLSNNYLNVKGAAPKESLANESNVEYVTCETNPQDVVILVKAGDETKIIYEKKNCQIIQIANCQVLEAIEKFQVHSILDAKKRRESSS